MKRINFREFWETVCPRENRENAYTNWVKATLKENGIVNEGNEIAIFEHYVYPYYMRCCSNCKKGPVSICSDQECKDSISYENWEPSEHVKMSMLATDCENIIRINTWR